MYLVSMQSVMLPTDTAIFLLLLDSEEQDIPIDVAVNPSLDHWASSSDDDVELLSDVDGGSVAAEPCDNENTESVGQPPQPDHSPQPDQ